MPIRKRRSNDYLFTHQQPVKKKLTDKERARNLILAGVGLVGVLMAGYGVNDLRSDDPPPDSSAEEGFTDKEWAEFQDDLLESQKERIENAGYDAYYRRLAEVFKLPRAEMDWALSIAPSVCYQYWYLEDEETAKAIAYDLVREYPSVHTQDTRAGKYGWEYIPTYWELVDSDAFMFVFNTAYDYCPSLPGY